MKHIRTLYIFIILILLSSTPFIHAAPAAIEQRTALVIGNGAYSTGPLKNPVNDAADIAATLQRLGFSVIIKKNASQRVMEESIREFGNRLKRGGIGLFYYAGHGMQVNGVNYLIPIAAKINEESDVKYEAIDANKVLDAMANANNGLNIVILDACRDNPLTRSFRDATRGLAIVSSAPVGTLISYSTGPGGVARDGEGRNSPYAAALIKHMAEPGQPVEQVFKNVRQTLATQSGGKQIPWELSSLQGNFFFNPGSAKTATGPSPAVMQTEKTRPADDSAADALERAMTKIQHKNEAAENMKAERQEQFKALLADVKKYRVIVNEDIDIETKASAWKALAKRYPSWSAGVETGKADKIIARAFAEDTDGSFKRLAGAEGFDFYVANADGTVLDMRTGLMWAARDNCSSAGWQDAKSYCETYRGGGYADWRMPTQDELAGLYDTNKSYRLPSPMQNNSVHLTVLIQLSSATYWASDTRGSDAAVFFFVHGERSWLPKASMVYSYGMSQGVPLVCTLPVRSGR